MKKLTILILCFWAYPLPAITQEYNNITPRSVIIQEPNKNYLFLGYNYDDISKKRYHFACLKGKKIEAGNTKSTVLVKHNIDYDTIAKINSGNLNANVDSIKFSAGVGSSWASEVSHDKLTNNINITFFYTPKKEILISENMKYGALKITNICKNFYNPSTKRYNRDFGNSFITAINRVAILSISLVIKSLNKEDRDFLSGNIRVSALKVAGFKGDLKKEIKKLKDSTTITLIIKQIGGNPSKILKFVGNNGKIISDCSLSKANNIKALNRCLIIFNKLIEYAQNNFKNQLNNISDYSISGYHTSKFEYSGVESLKYKGPHKFIDIEQKNLIALLKNKYKKYLSDNKISNYKLNFSEKLSDKDRKNLIKVSELSFKNMETIKSSIIFCEKNPYGKVCIENYENKKNEIIIYNFN